MNLYLTRRFNGTWMLTKRPPEYKLIDGTRTVEAWPAVGDRIRVENLCDYSTSMLAPELHAKAKPLDTFRVKVTYQPTGTN